MSDLQVLAQAAQDGSNVVSSLWQLTDVKAKNFEAHVDAFVSESERMVDATTEVAGDYVKDDAFKPHFKALTAAQKELAKDLGKLVKPAKAAKPAKASKRAKDGDDETVDADAEVEADEPQGDIGNSVWKLVSSFDSIVEVARTKIANGE